MDKNIIVTTRDMRKADEQAINEKFISSYNLMLRVGKILFKHIRQKNK